MNGFQADVLYNGILEEAERQGKMILDQAHFDAQQLEQSYNAKIELMQKKEEEKKLSQLQELQRKEESAIRTVQRKFELSYKEVLRERVISLVKQKMERLISERYYDDILAGWIAEAAVGLGRDKAFVSCSFKEHISQQTLNKAQELILRATGKKIELFKGSEVLSSQGVIVTSSDQSVSYDNRVVTRLIRYAKQIEHLLEGQEW